MILFKTAHQLNSYIGQHKEKDKRLGFVPTMGALHKGHLSLIDRAKTENNITVCSIFINPTQFNNPEDFKRYPVTIENDIEQLIASECDVLFLPDETEIYPAGFKKRVYSLGKLETILEGYYRPGHFQGVCQVVDRLLHIVQPDTLYLGQKDYQQTMVISTLTNLTGNKTKIVVVPTLREKNGLAMSSRNLRLTHTQQERATTIYKTLVTLKNNLHTTSISVLEAVASEGLEKAGFKVDYVAIKNAKTLEAVTESKSGAMALIAATIDGIRLIDNMLLN